MINMDKVIVDRMVNIIMGDAFKPTPMQTPTVKVPIKAPSGLWNPTVKQAINKRRRKAYRLAELANKGAFK